MRRTLFSWICLLALLRSANADTYRAYQNNNADGIYYFEVSEQHIARTPKWRADVTEPPLSLGRAVALARSILPRTVRNPKVWRVGMVRVQRIEKSDNWIYLVELVGPPYHNPGDFSAQAPSIDVPVLMDGTVSYPKFIPGR